MASSAFRRSDQDDSIVLVPEAHIWRLPGQGILLHWQRGLLALQGAMSVACIERLGGRPVLGAELFGRLKDLGSPDQIMRLVRDWQDDGLLVADEGEQRESYAAALERAEDAEVTLVPCPLSKIDHLSPQSEPWCPVDAMPQGLSVGPIFWNTSDDPCVTCLAKRTRAHDDLGRLLEHANGADQLQIGTVSASVSLSDQDLTAKALKRLKTLPSGKILLFARDTGHWQEADAPRIAGCEACGAAAQNICVSPSKDGPIRGGGYRPMTAEAFVRQIEPFVDPVGGVIRDLHPFPMASAAQDLSHVVLARHAFPLAAPTLASTLRNRQGRSAGKGRTRDAARASAMAEAYERYAGLARPGDVDLIATAAELPGRVIAPEDWMLFSPAQCANWRDWAGLSAVGGDVPAPLASDIPNAWTKVQHLSSGEAAFAPAALCWHQYTPSPGEAFPGRADSNGCAAGQRLEDALLQALLELIERDAVGVWWWTRSIRPRISVSSLEDPWIEAVETALATLGFELTLLDLTHDLQIPVIAAIGWPKGGMGPMLLGFGAHLSHGLAASRAVSEVLQVLPDRPAEDVGGAPWDGLAALPKAPTATLDDFRFLQGSQPDDAVKQTPPPASIEDALAYVQQRLCAAGLEIFTLDQSRPDVPIPVVRAIVPGLRHFRPRLAPGRLFDVPDTLGWRTRAQGPNQWFIPQ